MRKYIAIFGVVLLGGIILALAVYIGCQDDRYTREVAQKAAALHQGASSANLNVMNSPENVPGHELNAPSWYGWYGFFRWPNGTTAWAIILTLIAIVEQAKQTAVTAKAALKQAEHIETTERAWLIINYVDMKGTEHKDGEAVSSRWTIKNVGSTPAILLETKARFYVTSIYPEMTEYPMKELAEIPAYGNPIFINERLLAPNDSVGYFTKWEKGVDGKFVEFAFPARADRIWMIIAYGYVKYRDTFGKDHESRSCDFTLIGRNDQMVVDFLPSPEAPAAYNRCT
jgi:hypothetical protein